MIKKWNSDKWKSINIEMKRCQYRKLITDLEETLARNEISEEIYNNKQ